MIQIDIESSVKNDKERSHYGDDFNSAISLNWFSYWKNLRNPQNKTNTKIENFK